MPFNLHREHPLLHGDCTTKRYVAFIDYMCKFMSFAKLVRERISSTEKQIMVSLGVRLCFGRPPERGGYSWRSFHYFSYPAFGTLPASSG